MLGWVVAYLLIVTVVTPDHIQEQPWYRGGYPELKFCLDDKAFYEKHWPKIPDTKIYLRCEQLFVHPQGPFSEHK